METAATTKKKKSATPAAPPPAQPGYPNLIDVRDLVPGCTVRAANGEFMEVARVDPVIDPRGGIYESTSNEAIVWLRAETSSTATPVLLSGKIEKKTV